MEINYERIHKLCFLNREDLYKDKQGIAYKKFSTRLREIDKNPFIGFVGRKYSETKIKVLFLGKSNAESASWGQDKDIQINEYFIRFKNSEDNLESNYRAYANQYSDKSTGAFSTWNINRYPVYFRNKTRLDVEEIAYANIVPFRYKGAPNQKAYEIAFENFTNEFISIIEPNQIIPLGSNLDFNVVTKYLDVDLNIKISNGIFRVRGDTKISEEGKQTLDVAIKDYEDLILEH